MKKRRQSPSPANRFQVEIHKLRDEFLWNLRRLARRGDEGEFKTYGQEVVPDMPTTSGCFCTWLGSNRNVPKMFAANAVIPTSSRIAEAGSTDHAQSA